jgi:DNA polymerase III epsilon subunit-like protein
MIISNELERYGETELFAEWKKIDRSCTMNMARGMKITSSFKLAELYKYFFLREADGELHQADTDTRLCAELYFYLSTLT